MDPIFNEQCLSAHNELRVLHNSPPLVLCEKLADDAQTWAEYMAATSTFIHADLSKEFGENIASSTREQMGDEVTLQWYVEVFDYVFGQEKQTYNKVGHFSQLIWKDTTEVGFGKCKSEKGKWYYVARYRPAANGMGKFLANIEKYGEGWEEHPLVVVMNSKRIVPQVSEEGDPNHKVVSLTKKTTEENGIEITEVTEVFLTLDGKKHTKKSVTKKAL